MFGSLLTMCEVKTRFWVVKQSGTLNPEDNLILLDTSGNEEQNVFRLEWFLSGSSPYFQLADCEACTSALGADNIHTVANMKAHEVVSKSSLFRSEKST